jgi:hypothetical protein
MFTIPPKLPSFVKMHVLDSFSSAEHRLWTKFGVKIISFTRSKRCPLLQKNLTILNNSVKCRDLFVCYTKLRCLYEVGAKRKRDNTV